MTVGSGSVRRIVSVVVGLVLLAPLVADAIADVKTSSGGTAVVHARPIVAFHPSEPDRTRFGDLEFLGGLVLSGDVPDFQSLSALTSRDHGRELLSASDEGSWISFRLRTDDAGRPQAVDDVRIAPVLGIDGRPFAHKWERDSESLAVRPRADGGGEVLVGFEGHHRVLAYRFRTDPSEVLGTAARPVPGIPAEIPSLRANRGLEGLAVAPPGTPLAGSLLLVAEEPRPGEADQPVWIVGGPRPGLLHLARRDHFANTDAAFLPNGDLIVLQRRFGFRIGLGMRLLRIAAADLRPGRTVEGRELVTADWGWEIDNMEGLAIDTAPDGGTILTLVSDDNGSWLQRTILLRFRLHEPGE